MRHSWVEGGRSARGVLDLQRGSERLLSGIGEVGEPALQATAKILHNEPYLHFSTQASMSALYSTRLCPSTLRQIVSIVSMAALRVLKSWLPPAAAMRGRNRRSRPVTAEGQTSIMFATAMRSGARPANWALSRTATILRRKHWV